MKYKILTQIDITRSRPLRDDPDMVKQGQQANFNSLRQAIELRAIIVDDRDPFVEDGWWVYEFNTDREDQFLKNNDPVGHLVDDIDGIPFISGLNTTVDIAPAVFKTKGTKINTKVVFDEYDDKYR